MSEIAKKYKHDGDGKIFTDDGEHVDWLAECIIDNAQGVVDIMNELYIENMELKEGSDISALKWSEEREPNDEVSYDHVKAETPFGRFLITWKGWKDHDSPTVDETPWGDYWDSFCSVEDAKEACFKEYKARIRACSDQY